MRYQRDDWGTELLLAMRSKGGRPADANERDDNPRLWASVAKRF